MCKNPYGISQKTEMSPVSQCTSDITPATTIKTVGRENYLLDPAKRLFCEQKQGTLFSCGENSSTAAGSKESIAPYSETRAVSLRLSLSDRLTQSLISAGLVKGITPTSVRKQLGAEIPDIVSWSQAGENVEKQKADC